MKQHDDAKTLIEKLENNEYLVVEGEVCGGRVLTIKDNRVYGGVDAILRYAAVEAGKPDTFDRHEGPINLQPVDIDRGLFFVSDDRLFWHHFSLLAAVGERYTSSDGKEHDIEDEAIEMNHDGFTVTAQQLRERYYEIPDITQRLVAAVRGILLPPDKDAKQTAAS